MKNVLFLSDLASGVYWWRCGAYVYDSRQRLRPVAALSETTFPILDPNVLKSVSVLNVCTRYDDWLPSYLTELKKGFPNVKVNVFYDDLNYFDDIPRYNNGRNFYKPRGDLIKRIMAAADNLVTTTPYLKKKLNERYEKPLEKIICLPNLIPEFWMQPVMSGMRVEAHKAVKNGERKPRIGICSTGNHINCQGFYEAENGEVCKQAPDGKWITESGIALPDFAKKKWIADDMSVIESLVRATCDRWDWVFVGTSPASMADLIQTRKVEFHPGTPISTWLPYLNTLRLDCFVAPLLDNTFNRCKSPIKALEAHVLGLPIFTSNVGVYDGLVGADFMFGDGDELKGKLETYFQRSEAYVETEIKNCMETMFKPFELDGQKWNGWIMERNMSQLDGIFI